MMRNGDPQDRFFYPTLTVMKDSFNEYIKGSQVIIPKLKCNSVPEDCFFLLAIGADPTEMRQSGLSLMPKHQV